MDPRALAATHVLDVDGRPSRLEDQWRDRPAVVVWLRHFGCIYCREQTAELRDAKNDIGSLGARLVFVGNGGPQQAKAFRDQFAPGCTVLTDPELASYRAIGARSGLYKTLGPHTWGAALRAFRRGARQTSVQGHPFQQGGVLVVAPREGVLYSYLSASAGDHPAVDDILTALRTRQSGIAASRLANSA